MAQTHIGRGLTSISFVGLACLCQCSIFYEVSALNAAGDDGNAASSDDGAGLDGRNEGGIDGMIGGGDDSAGLDANAQSGDARNGDADGADATDGGQIEGATDGAGGDVVGFDAADAAGAMDAFGDAGTLGMGLVAYYPFNESSGTTSADASGHGLAATMVGATFAAGVNGNAASLNGTTGYVSLPAGIVSTLTSFSICTWLNLTTSPPHNHIWDFGTGTTAYMDLSASSTAAPPTLQFAITTTGSTNAQRINAPVLPLCIWQHVCVTLAGTTGAIFVNGALAAQALGITVSPSSLGSTAQNWLGRSQFADPLMHGRIDNFRIYSRTLSSAEILQLFQQQL